MRTNLKYCADRAVWLFGLAALSFSSLASADAVAVPCIIDEFRSSIPPLQDAIARVEDLGARAIAACFELFALTKKPKEVRGAGAVTDSWITIDVLDRNHHKCDG